MRGDGDDDRIAAALFMVWLGFCLATVWLRVFRFDDEQTGE